MKKTELSYEEAMKRLQEIVGRLESGEEALEDSMKLFEEGAALSALCYQKLDRAEQKITELTKVKPLAGDADEQAE